MKPAIEVTDLTKRYILGQNKADGMLREALVGFLKNPFGAGKKKGKPLLALGGVNFSINRGEVVGIIGRNGAGKSTLLKVLSRITYPTSGKIQVNGRIASLLEVGTGFHEELTGRENVFLNGSIMGMSRKEIASRMKEIEEFAGVEKFMDTPIKRYSSGMRLRLGFAVAAHLDPDILLVDEVLAVGDIEFQKKCLKTMDDLRGGGRTVLFVSHNMAAVENLCQRCIWIDNGKVRMDGPADDVIKAYMSTFLNLKQSGGVDLRSIESRTGNGEGRFTGIEFLDKEGQTVNFICSGDSITIRLHFETSVTLSELRIGIEVHNETGLRVTSSNNFLTGYEVFQLAPGKWSIDWEIDFLNFMPGSYNLSLWLGWWENFQDVLKHAVILDVQTSDYFKTGRGIESRYGLLFLPSRWKSDTLPAPVSRSDVNA